MEKIKQTVKGKNTMKNVEQKAIAFFGTTHKPLIAGYIISSGEMLDFSGKNQGASGFDRQCDHREIASCYDEIGEMSGTDALIDFLNRGNIRLMPECGGVELVKVPTTEQIKALRHYINFFNGEIVLDISDYNGNVILSYEYSEKTASSRIINDIKAVFTQELTA